MSIYKLEALHNYLRTNSTLACSIESGSKIYLRNKEKLTQAPYFIVYKEEGLDIGKDGVCNKAIRKVYYFKTVRGYVIRYLKLRYEIEQKFSDEPCYYIKDKKQF